MRFQIEGIQISKALRSHTKMGDHYTTPNPMTMMTKLKTILYAKLAARHL